jgi:hypothetical protein
MSTNVRERFRRRVAQVIDALGADTELLRTAYDHGHGLFVELRGESTISIYDEPRENVYRGLRRAVESDYLERDLCEEQISVFRENGGVPCVIFGYFEDQWCWSFDRFHPPASASN